MQARGSLIFIIGRERSESVQRSFMDDFPEPSHSTDPLEILTLGGLAIRQNGQAVEGFISQKVRALLVYLACTARPQPRMVLAELFWPELAEGRALANLRVALNNLRRAAGSHLDITRESVSVRSDCRPYLDAAEFDTRVRAALTMGAIADPGTVEDALALYQGDFLQGFYVDSASFEQWAALERDRLRFLFFNAADRLIEGALARQDYATGATLAARALEIDPLREETHRQLMRALAHSGQRAAALAQYRTCQRLLRDELNTAPSMETTHLHERLQSSDVSPPSARDSVTLPLKLTCNLPPQPLSFVGREPEIAELSVLLGKPDCQLITIAGPGGCGKTRLAVEVARSKTHDFEDGVWFVPLASVTTADTLIAAISSALGLGFTAGTKPPRDELLEHLRERRLLLLLDNFEQLVHAVGVIEDILTTAPSCKLLVTSRQALNLAWEWPFWLAGMAYPDNAETDHLESYSAVQLFVERARRVRHVFSIRDDPAGIVQICQMVEGLPLGIEIAASWLRVMSCQQITQELTQLEVMYTPVERRHRSLRALFENAWERLSEPEQRMIMRLSVFRGGFRLDTAEAVASITVTALAALVNQSLIRADYLTGRFDMHQLFRDFAQAQLHSFPAEEQLARERHAQYYLGMLHAFDHSPEDGQPRISFEDILPDIDNVRAAWEWAVTYQRMDLISQGCAGLGNIYALASYHHEALATFQHALSSLEDVPPSGERDRLELALSMCLVPPTVVVCGWTSDATRQVAEHARRLAASLDAPHDLFQSLLILSLFYGNEEWERSQRIAEEALELAQRSNQSAEIMARATLETSLMFTGEFVRALEQAERVLSLAEMDNDPDCNTFLGVDLEITALAHASYVRCLMGYPEQSLQGITTALRRAQALEAPTAQAFALGFSGLCYRFLDMPDALETVAAALEAIATEHGFQHWLPFPPSFRGSALIRRGDLKAGMDLIQESLRIARAQGNLHLVPLRLAELGWAYGRAGRVEEGLAEIDKAETLAERTGERQHQAELCRIGGELLMLNGDRRGAEHRLQQAIAIAQQQKARLLELRATMSLCRVLSEAGRASEAKLTLSAVLARFSEGLELPPLMEARALAGQLALLAQSVE